MHFFNLFEKADYLFPPALSVYAKLSQLPPPLALYLWGIAFMSDVVTGTDISELTAHHGNKSEDQFHPGYHKQLITKH